VRAALVCVLVALVPAATARADYPAPPLTRPLTGLRYTESLRIAEEFWEATPACAVRFYAATDRELRASTGRAAYAAVRDVQVGDECPVWIGPDLAAAVYDNRIDACSVIAHELGHLLGFPHDPDPGSVMYPLGPPLVYGCYRRFLPRGYGLAWREEHGPPVWSHRPVT
jgi:hypothetical protein